MTDLSGKSVIITGGSKGIGRETARQFLQAGASVAITGRSEESLKNTLSDLIKIGPPVISISGDVSVENDCRQAVREVLKEFGRIDILVNNAGMSARGLFSESEIVLYQALTGINFLGPVMMSRLCLEEITANRGSIVFISTLAGLKGLPGLSHYSSSKMPLTAFSESIRSELRPAGVHVGIIYVGFTDNDPDKTIYDAAGNRILLKRDRNSMTRQQVASAVLKAVIRRRESVTLSVPGKFVSVLYRFFPRITGRLLSRLTLRSPRYRSRP